MKNIWNLPHFKHKGMQFNKYPMDPTDYEIYHLIGEFIKEDRCHWERCVDLITYISTLVVDQPPYCFDEDSCYWRFGERGIMEFNYCDTTLFVGRSFFYERNKQTLKELEEWVESYGENWVVAEYYYGE